MFELKVRYQNQKSFYGKAVCLFRVDYFILKSYNSEVIRFNPYNGKIEFLEDANYSATTRRHVWEYLHLLNDMYGVDLMNYYASICKSLKVKSFAGFLRVVKSVETARHVCILKDDQEVAY